MYGPLKFLAGRVFRHTSTLLETSSPIFLQREMQSLQKCGQFPARKMAAGNRPRLRERFGIFSSKTATDSEKVSDSGKLALHSGTLLNFLLKRLPLPS